MCVINLLKYIGFLVTNIIILQPRLTMTQDSHSLQSVIIILTCISYHTKDFYFQAGQMHFKHA